MKRLRRFWRNNAGLLGVLCGAALVLAAVLYLNSGQPVRMVLAEPTEPPPTRTPEWEEIMRLLKERTKTPEPTRVPEITPLPEFFYEDMYSEIRGMDGKRLFDLEKVDNSVPSPGFSGRKYDDYTDRWDVYFGYSKRYVVYKGFVFCPGETPPVVLKDIGCNDIREHNLSLWKLYIDEVGNDIRSDFPKVKGKNKEEISDWMDDQMYEGTYRVFWGDWIIDMRYPPPGYDISEDPLKALGYDDEMIIDIRDRGDWFDGDGYADVWMKFFEENPDMLYID